MEDKTKDFLNKVKVNTYIYTFTFIALSIGYGLKYSIGAEPMILILGAFAFYTLGRQVRLAQELEAGGEVNNQPRQSVWIRGVTFLVVLLLAITMMFILFF